MLKSIHTRHNDIFLTLLRRSRVERRLRQTDLATKLGHVQATISKVERGERRLDVLELRAWLAALDVDFQDFMNELHRQLGDWVVPEARFRTRSTASASAKAIPPVESRLPRRRSG